MAYIHLYIKFETSLNNLVAKIKDNFVIFYFYSYKLVAYFPK